jgi:hypothetical protein
MSRPLTGLAWLNVFLHLTGLGLAAIYMRPGTLLTPLAERHAYLASWPIGWMCSWAWWAVCAFVMIGFALAVAARIDTPLARFAAWIAVAGAAVDLTCDTLFAVYLPAHASDIVVSDFEFINAERAIGFVSLFIANGLYSLSTLFLSIAIYGFAPSPLVGEGRGGGYVVSAPATPHPNPPPPGGRGQEGRYTNRTAILAVGIGVFVCGMLLSAAGVTGVPEHAFWATGPTIGLYCVWVLLVARSLERA